MTRRSDNGAVEKLSQLLTPQHLRQLKFAGVVTVMTLLCGIFLWYLFAPKPAPQQAGAGGYNIHSCISNDTNISFEVDARHFIVADRKLTKRTAQQQSTLEVLRVCNDPAVVRGHQRQRTVFALPKLTISDDKVLLLEIIEKNGARHQTVEIPAEELLEAKLL